MTETIELKLAQTLAFTHVTDHQAEVNAQLQALYQKSVGLQGQLESITKEIFAEHGIDFEVVQAPTLSDDKTKITYEVGTTPTVKDDSSQDGGSFSSADPNVKEEKTTSKRGSTKK